MHPCSATNFKRTTRKPCTPSRCLACLRSAARPCLNVLLLTCALLLATVAPAHAYIDPGSGLLLWQLVVSVFVGTVVYQYRRVVNFIFRKQRKQEKPDE
jgi:hypothetical protein